MTVTIYINGDKHPDKMLNDVSDFEVNESFLIVKSNKWRALYHFMLRDITGFKVQYEYNEIIK